MSASVQTDKWTRFQGFDSADHYFDLALDYDNPSARSVRVFAREVVAPHNRDKADLPWMVWFSGGPGFPAPRPESASGWLARALKDYRVLLLDQRGTGLSSAITHDSLAMLPNAAAQADYLKHFRADNIVRDAEEIRKKLGVKKWTTIGQSFGGFCTTSYLSLAPEGLEASIIFGGLPPLVNQPDDLYRATYRQVAKKNEQFYKRFPDDVAKVREIVSHLSNNKVLLPNGEVLTVERFRQCGILLGFTSAGSSLTAIHYLLERAFLPETKENQLSHYFLRKFEQLTDLNTNPIYALLHEAIYCEGRASNWSASRMLSEYPAFDVSHDPLYFFGEMIYPSMFDEYACLIPLKEAANILANKTDWPKLYDVEVLGRNTVPVVACVYVDDMYVDFDFGMQTAKAINGIKLWITNEYEHDAIRVDGEHVLDRLLNLLNGPAS